MENNLSQNSLLTHIDEIESIQDRIPEETFDIKRLPFLTNILKISKQQRGYRKIVCTHDSEVKAVELIQFPYSSANSQVEWGAYWSTVCDLGLPPELLISARTPRIYDAEIFLKVPHQPPTIIS